jgi:serine/threonine protein kinase
MKLSRTAYEAQLSPSPPPVPVPSLTLEAVTTAHQLHQNPRNRESLVQFSTEEDKEEFMSRFRGVRVLGQGISGVVVLAQLRPNVPPIQPRREYYAIKISLVSGAERISKPRVIREKQDLVYPTQEEVDKHFDQDERRAVDIDPWQLPAIRAAIPFLELHNWYYVNRVSAPLSEAERRTWVSNVAQLIVGQWLYYGWNHTDSRRLFEQLGASSSSSSSSTEEEDEEEKQTSIRLSAALGIAYESRNPAIAAAAVKPKKKPPFGCPVQIIVMEYVPAASGLSKGTIDDALSIRKAKIPWMFERVSNFASVWTQVLGTLAHLRDTLELSHGDLHANNVMLTDPPPPQQQQQQGAGNKPQLFVYRVNIRDHHQRVSSWIFRVDAPRYLVKIIDFGRSRIHVADEPLAAAAKRIRPEAFTWSSDFSDYYLLRGDVYTLACAMFLHLLKVLAEDKLRNKIIRDVFLSEAYKIGVILLHALERTPPPNNDLRFGFKTIYHEWTRSSLFTDSSRIDELQKKAVTWYAIASRQSESVSGCIMHRNRTEQCAKPLDTLEQRLDDPGRWSLDEHLVLFASELGGVLAEQFSGVENAKLTHEVWMTPSTRGLPAEAAARRQQYPLFRCDDIGPEDSTQQNGINSAIRRYRLTCAASDAQQ